MIGFDQTKPRDVAAFGRATVDLYANGFGTVEEISTFSKYVGGSPANTAVAMANLGLRVGYIGRVSDDPFGRYVVGYLAAKGVDTSHIVRDTSGVRTGVTIGEFRSEKECSYFMYRTDCADLHIDCAQLDEPYIAAHKLLLISGTSLSHSPAREAVFLAIAYARRNGTKVAFDLDYREGTWASLEEASIYYKLAAERADLVYGTREEFNVMEHCFYPGKEDNAWTAEWLLQAGVSLVSIKRGKQGSDVYLQGGKMHHGGIFPAKVENTFGAGDAYAGSFNCCLLHGKSISEALRYAAAAAAITISGQSCSDSMPNLSQVEAYMAAQDYQR